VRVFCTISEDEKHFGAAQTELQESDCNILRLLPFFRVSMNNTNRTSSHIFPGASRCIWAWD